MRKDNGQGSIERRILGIPFFSGEAQDAIEQISKGGLLVAPAAPALTGMVSNESYRNALVNADIAITDSAFMVVLWNWLQGDSLTRLSGLKYLRELLLRDDCRVPGNTLWIMASEESARKNLSWLRSEGIVVPEDCVYVAPFYGAKDIEDEALIEHLHRRQIKHIVITIGGGTQERLGYYIKRRLAYSPAIHCIGAAIAFLSGDQVRIPNWADRFYLGWLFRCVSEPRRYVPRYYSALGLVRLLWHYREAPPV